MKAKALETLLATESGLGSEMVTRFQVLRQNDLLSKRRGINAEDLDTKLVISGILSVVARRPAHAGRQVIKLQNLKAIGHVSDAFGGVTNLAEALKKALEDPELLATVEEVRLYGGDEEPATASILYGDGLESIYMPLTLLSGGAKGAEKTFARHKIGRSIRHETVLTPRFLKRVATQMSRSAGYDRLKEMATTLPGTNRGRGPGQNVTP